MQVGGRYFAERALTFGCSSSPGIFCCTAELVLELACLVAGFCRGDCAKQLDDAMALGDRMSVQHWYDTYKSVAGRVGVSLADGSDPEKAFGASKSGTLLGIFYDLHKFTWQLSTEKSDKILRLLKPVIEEELVENSLLMTLCGKLSYYAPIFGDEARFDKAFLLSLVDHGAPKSQLIRISSEAKKQAKWWWMVISASVHPSKIPFPQHVHHAGALELFSDAAGGGHMEGCHGMGGVLWNIDERRYTVWPWPELIRYSLHNSLGHCFAHKLTFLEGCASLFLLLSVSDVVPNMPVRLFVDNAGSVWAFRKGHSKDLYTYTVVKAIYSVARALNVDLEIIKVRRCSVPGAVVADLLSKGKVPEGLDMMGGNTVADMGFISRVFLKFLEDPVPDRALGFKIVEEMAQVMDVVKNDLSIV